MSAYLEIRNVHLRFGGVEALTDVSFESYENTVLGVIGPNGAGKTALLNCICGVYRPQEGTILLNGQPLTGRRPEAIARAGIGRTFQGMDHFSEFIVADYVLLGRTGRIRGRCIGSAFALPSVDRTERRERGAVAEVLERCGLSGYAQDRLSEVPYGIQKQIDMARVIAAGSKVVLLDEPTSGTTSSEREVVLQALSLLVEQKVCIVLIDHDVDFVSRCCQNLVAMSSGRVIAVGSVKEVLSSQVVLEAFIGAPT